MVHLCSQCSKLRPNTSKSTHKWPISAPFERMHMDWAFVKDVGNILIIVDSGTGWIEAFPTQNRESSTVIQCLRTVFTRFGVPHLLVTDNAKEFTSKDFNEWISYQGIRKLESPIYYPKANGLAERGVQTIKKGLKAWTESKTHCDFITYLQRLLFHHRITSSCRGKSPAELVFNRQIRTPSILPTISMQQGDKVWFKPHARAASISSTYLMPKGRNTSWILSDEDDDEPLIMASNNQIATRRTSENEIEEEVVMADSQDEPRHSKRQIIPPKRFGYSVD